MKTKWWKSIYFTFVQKCYKLSHKIQHQNSTSGYSLLGISSKLLENQHWQSAMWAVVVLSYLNQAAIEVGNGNVNHSPRLHGPHFRTKQE